ncbi:hypothetical protein LOC71_07710 [Rhodopirellula sp. JC740]|uniref:Zinc ribbon domain-containing protein n=1 Tax=Rhodopirellula halodulae TaxID=2894198 RepID=A0ABS8NF18_9BACT|nr:zinc ribbon domain-containing protein [Rhodopirellula sp. JC740]MCC9642155.1 hypothetical protein [Rhodopirellula sp. JC740]
MKPSLISLRCDHCGAPIDVKPKAKFVTCGYCRASLAIHHTGSSYSTETIDELRETTEALVKDVQQIKRSTELNRLDDEWERERLRLLGTNKHGRQITSPPNTVVSTIVFAGVILFAIFWTIMASMMFAPMAFFGLIFIGFAIVGMISTHNAKGKYDAAHRRYQRERTSLIREIQGDN